MGATNASGIVRHAARDSRFPFRDRTLVCPALIVSSHHERMTSTDSDEPACPTPADAVPAIGGDASAISASSAPARPSGARRRAGGVAGVLALLVAIIWGVNFIRVSHPVAVSLERDSRNAGFTLRAHYAYYVQSGTLVLDLTRIDSAAPIDLLRGAFAAADTLYDHDRVFDRVIFARNGTPVFFMKGDDFQAIGADMRMHENPAYVVRTFPQKLYKPSGEPAYGTWEGGMLGVLGHQMQDVGDAARTWAGVGDA
jgi:hypothetical protein